MKPADYEAMLKLSIEAQIKLDSALVEHAKGCELPTDECPTCYPLSMDFKKRFGAYLCRERDPLTGREKLYAWYLDKRYAFLQRLWIRGWIGPDRPDYTEENWDTELLLIILRCGGKIARGIRRLDAARSE